MFTTHLTSIEIANIIFGTIFAFILICPLILALRSIYYYNSKDWSKWYTYQKNLSEKVEICTEWDGKLIPTKWEEIERNYDLLQRKNAKTGDIDFKKVYHV